MSQRWPGENRPSERHRLFHVANEYVRALVDVEDGIRDQMVCLAAKVDLCEKWQKENAKPVRRAFVQTRREVQRIADGYPAQLVPWYGAPSSLCLNRAIIAISKLFTQTPHGLMMLDRYAISMNWGGFVEGRPGFDVTIAPLEQTCVGVEGDPVWWATGAVNMRWQHCALCEMPIPSVQWFVSQTNYDRHQDLMYNRQYTVVRVPTNGVAEVNCPNCGRRAFMVAKQYEAPMDWLIRHTALRDREVVF